jgi:hypothetical protein
MSDDFGTVNVKQKGREIELLRQHYLRHRDSIRELMADAPTEHLSNEYQRLIADIDAALSKIAEIEGRPGATIPPPAPPHPARSASPDFLRARTQPGTVPLNTYDPDATQIEYASEADANPRSRVALIVVAGALVLAVIGWMIWRASSNRADDATPIVGAPVTETTGGPVAGDTAPATPAIETSSLAVSPDSADYGTIRKGTRAVRQFEVANNSDEPVSIQIVRSTCRCLYYDHAEVVPPRGKETVTVTVDGARAKAGALRETVKVSSKKDPSIATTFTVAAQVQ